MLVASRFPRPGRADVVLSVPALISRSAGYAIRMSGAVGGVLSDGRYPYRRRDLIMFNFKYDWPDDEDDPSQVYIVDSNGYEMLQIFEDPIFFLEATHLKIPLGN